MPQVRPRRYAGWLLAAVGLAAGGWLLATPAGAQEELLQQLKTIEKVELEGNRRLKDGTLRKVMKTRPLSIWPWADRPMLRLDFLRADVASLKEVYRRHGFPYADIWTRVDTDSAKNRVAVTFTIVEGVQVKIRRVQLAGDRFVPERDVRKRLLAKPDKPFDPAFLGLDGLTIRELYADHGYLPEITGNVTRDDPAETTLVTVNYAIDAGPRYRVGDIYITTDQAEITVPEPLVRRELLLKPGDIYSNTRRVRSQEQLYETGLFRQVQFTPLPDSATQVMNFHLRVRERKPGYVDAGVGSGSDERFRVTADWGHRNLFQRGMGAGIGSKLSFYGDGHFQRVRVEASVIEPWMFRTRTWGRAAPYFEIHDDRADPRAVVHQQFTGINFSLRRSLSRHTDVELIQQNAWVNQDLEILVANLTEAERTELESSIVSTYTTHTLALGLQRNSRDNPFYPTRGSVQQVAAQVAGGPLKGTSSFYKGTAESGWYFPLNRNGWVFATRVRVGAVTPFGDAQPFSPDTVIDARVAAVPLEDRFRIGGVNSLRGYNENALPPSGGLAEILGSVEVRVPTPVRIPFLGTLGLEAYMDAGNVWTHPDDIKLEHFVPEISREPLSTNEVRYVVGLGPRLDLPIGPLRVDISWGLRPDVVGPSYGKANWQFAIGPSF